jgi:hypothetical protein
LCGAARGFGKVAEQHEFGVPVPTCLREEATAPKCAGRRLERK